MKKCIYCKKKLDNGAVFCAFCGGKQDEKPAKRQKAASGSGKRHPILSFLLFLIFIITFNLGMLAVIVRGLTSDEYVRGFIGRTYLSDIEVGEVILDALDGAGKASKKGMWAKIGSELEDDTELGELVYLVFKDDCFINVERNDIDYGLDDKEFRDGIAGLAVAYKNDLLYETGEGRVREEDIEKFYNILLKPAMERNIEDAWNSNRGNIYNIYPDHDSYYADMMHNFDETIKMLVEKNLENKDLKDVQVKRLAKKYPIWVIRLFVSVPFIIGMFVCALITVITTFTVNYRGARKETVKALVIVLIEVCLTAAAILGVYLLKSNLKSIISEVLSNYISYFA